jgi:hypothetical protein
LGALKTRMSDFAGALNKGTTHAGQHDYDSTL